MILRLPGPDDTPAIATELADPEVMRFIGNGETGSFQDAAAAVASMQRAWELDGFGQFVVVRRADGERIGRVGLLAWDPAVWRSSTRSAIGGDAEIELGWKLARTVWRNGSLELWLHAPGGSGA